MIIIMVAIILAMMQNRQLMILNSCIIERRSVLFSKWSTKYNWLCCLYQELVAKISISVVRQITLFEIKVPGPSVCAKCNFITAFEQLLSLLHCVSHVCVGNGWVCIMCIMRGTMWEVQCERYNVRGTMWYNVYNERRSKMKYGL